MKPVMKGLGRFARRVLHRRDYARCRWARHRFIHVKNRVFESTDNYILPYVNAILDVPVYMRKHERKLVGTKRFYRWSKNHEYKDVLREMRVRRNFHRGLYRSSVEIPKRSWQANYIKQLMRYKKRKEALKPKIEEYKIKLHEHESEIRTLNDHIQEDEKIIEQFEKSKMSKKDNRLSESKEVVRGESKVSEVDYIEAKKSRKLSEAQVRRLNRTKNKTAKSYHENYDEYLEINNEIERIEKEYSRDYDSRMDEVERESWSGYEEDMTKRCRGYIAHMSVLLISIIVAYMKGKDLKVLTHDRMIETINDEGIDVALDDIEGDILRQEKLREGYMSIGRDYIQQLEYVKAKMVSEPNNKNLLELKELYEKEISDIKELVDSTTAVIDCLKKTSGIIRSNRDDLEEVKKALNEMKTEVDQSHARVAVSVLLLLNKMQLIKPKEHSAIFKVSQNAAMLFVVAGLSVSKLIGESKAIKSLHETVFSAENMKKKKFLKYLKTPTSIISKAPKMVTMTLVAGVLNHIFEISPNKRELDNELCEFLSESPQCQPGYKPEVQIVDKEIVTTVAKTGLKKTLEKFGINGFALDLTTELLMKFKFGAHLKSLTLDKVDEKVVREKTRERLTDKGIETEKRVLDNEVDRMLAEAEQKKEMIKELWESILEEEEEESKLLSTALEQLEQDRYVGDLAVRLFGLGTRYGIDKGDEVE